VFYGWPSGRRPPTHPGAGRLNARRNAVMTDLEAKGIATRQGTHAPTILGYYAEKYGLRPEDFPNAYLADRLTLALPLYVQMSDDEQALVVDELTRAFEGS
jgi:perosamine synthetase